MRTESEFSLEQNAEWIKLRMERGQAREAPLLANLTSHDLSPEDHDLPLNEEIAHIIIAWAGLMLLKDEQYEMAEKQISSQSMKDKKDQQSLFVDVQNKDEECYGAHSFNDNGEFIRSSLVINQDLPKPGAEDTLIMMPQPSPFQPPAMDKTDIRLLDLFYHILAKKGQMDLADSELEEYIELLSEKSQTRIFSFGGLGSYLCTDPRFSIFQNIVSIVSPGDYPWQEEKYSYGNANKFNLNPGAKEFIPQRASHASVLFEKHDRNQNMSPFTNVALNTGIVEQLSLFGNDKNDGIPAAIRERNAHVPDLCSHTQPVTNNHDSWSSYSAMGETTLMSSVWGTSPYTPILKAVHRVDEEKDDESDFFFTSQKITSPDTLLDDHTRMQPVSDKSAAISKAVSATMNQEADHALFIQPLNAPSTYMESQDRRVETLSQESSNDEGMEEIVSSITSEMDSSFWNYSYGVLQAHQLPALGNDSNHLTSEKDSTPLTSDQDSTPLTSDQDSTPLTSDQDSTTLTSDQDSAPLTGHEQPDVSEPLFSKGCFCVQDDSWMKHDKSYMDQDSPSSFHDDFHGESILNQDNVFIFSYDKSSLEATTGQPTCSFINLFHPTPLVENDSLDRSATLPSDLLHTEKVFQSRNFSFPNHIVTCERGSAFFSSFNDSIGMADSLTSSQLALPTSSVCTAQDRTSKISATMMSSNTEFKTRPAVNFCLPSSSGSNYCKTPGHKRHYFYQPLETASTLAEHKNAETQTDIIGIDLEELFVELITIKKTQTLTEDILKQQAATKEALNSCQEQFSLGRSVTDELKHVVTFIKNRIQMAESSEERWKENFATLAMDHEILKFQNQAQMVELKKQLEAEQITASNFQEALTSCHEQLSHGRSMTDELKRDVTNVNTRIQMTETSADRLKEDMGMLTMDRDILKAQSYAEVAELKKQLKKEQTTVFNVQFATFSSQDAQGNRCDLSSHESLLLGEPAETKHHHVFSKQSCGKGNSLYSRMNTSSALKTSPGHVVGPIRIKSSSPQNKSGSSLLCGDSIVNERSHNLNSYRTGVSGTPNRLSNLHTPSSRWKKNISGRAKSFSSPEVGNNSLASNRNIISEGQQFQNPAEIEQGLEIDMEVDEGLAILSDPSGALTKTFTKAKLSSVSIEADTLKFKVMLVVDTNILISCLNFLQDILTCNIPGFGGVILVLPWIVMQELDCLKDRKYSVNNLMRSISTSHGARKAVKFIHTHLVKNISQLIGQTPQEAFKETDLPVECNDDRVLQCCQQFEQKYAGSQVVLLTRDINLLNKAMIMGIQAATDETLWSRLKVKKTISWQETNEH